MTTQAKVNRAKEFFDKKEQEKVKQNITRTVEKALTVEEIEELYAKLPKTSANVLALVYKTNHLRLFEECNVRKFLTGERVRKSDRFPLTMLELRKLQKYLKVADVPSIDTALCYLCGNNLLSSFDVRNFIYFYEVKGGKN